jgi:hypothetical protein
MATIGIDPDITGEPPEERARTRAGGTAEHHGSGVYAIGPQ